MPVNLLKHIMQWQGYPFRVASKELQRIQSLSVDEFMVWQQQAKWNIARYHYANNAFYKKMIGNTFPDRWEDLPIVTKKDLQRPLEQIVTGTLNDYYRGGTSGTSGVPFSFAKDKFAHAMTWALIGQRYRIYNITEESLHARFVGIPKDTIGYYRHQFKNYVMNRIGFDIFDLSDQAMQRYVHMFRQHKFEYLYGYTNPLVLFARYLQKHSIILKEICPTLKICISTSETSTPEDHALFEHTFGIPHIREYGISETCLTAFDTSQGWILSEETLFNEVINDTQEVIGYGQEGALLSTSLFNKAMPMIRYETGDRAILQAAAIGSRYQTIHTLAGRLNDTVILPSGRIAAGVTFYFVARSIFEKTNCLQEFIVRQVAPHHFIFDIVVSRDLLPAEIKEINQIISTYLEPGLTLTINRVDKIDRTPAGKLKYFYSELNR